MRRKMIMIMAWIQIVLAAALIAASPWWLVTVPEQEWKWFFAAAYLIFGAAFLVDAMRDLERCRGTVKLPEEPSTCEGAVETYFSAPDGTEVFGDVKIVPSGELSKQYICFPDGLNLIVEEGRYTGWYLPGESDHEVMDHG